VGNAAEAKTRVRNSIYSTVQTFFREGLNFLSGVIKAV
jgi:hypothetical protein